MTNQTIEQAVEEFDEFLDKYTGKHQKEALYSSLFADCVQVRKDIIVKEFETVLTQALQAQRDATLQEVLSMKRVAHQEKEVMYAQVSVVLGEVVPAQPVDNVRPLEYVKVFDIEKLTNINPTH